MGKRDETTVSACVKTRPMIQVHSQQENPEGVPDVTEISFTRWSSSPARETRNSLDTDSTRQLSIPPGRTAASGS